MGLVQLDTSRQVQTSKQHAMREVSTSQPAGQRTKAQTLSQVWDLPQAPKEPLIEQEKCLHLKVSQSTSQGFQSGSFHIVSGLGRVTS